MHPGDPNGPSFITVEELQGGALREVVDYWANNAQYLAEVCRTASETVEDRCRRRLLPFTDVVETMRASGVDPDTTALSDTEFMPGVFGNPSMPGPVGDGAMVRDFWVSNFPPRRADLWDYTACSVAITMPWGGVPVVIPREGFTGPTDDTGHIRLAYGTMCPVGADVAVTYSGGYVHGVPGALKQAARLVAVRRLILEVTPEFRPGMSLSEFDKEIGHELTGYEKK